MEYRIIIKDGVVTIMHNKYKFDSDVGDRGYLNHVEHNLEIPDFANKWTCHDCLMFWDQTTATDYADEVYALEQEEKNNKMYDEAVERNAERQAERQAEYDAENNIGGFDGFSYGDDNGSGYY